MTLPVIKQINRDIVTPSTIIIEIPEHQQLMKIKMLSWHGYKVVRYTKSEGVVTIVATKALEACLGRK